MASDGLVTLNVEKGLISVLAIMPWRLGAFKATSGLKENEGNNDKRLSDIL